MEAKCRVNIQADQQSRDNPPQMEYQMSERFDLIDHFHLFQLSKAFRLPFQQRCNQYSIHLQVCYTFDSPSVRQELYTIMSQLHEYNFLLVYQKHVLDQNLQVSIEPSRLINK